MPNWCSNVVRLRHKDPAMIARAAKGFKDGALLQTFIPCPQDLVDTTAGRFGDSDKQAALELKESANLKKHGFANWYDWCVANWGTKWDVGGSDGSISESTDNELRLGFDSAWSPPLEAFDRMISEQGFDIDAYYYEPGAAYCGHWLNGRDYWINIPGSSKEAEAVIPEDIDTVFDIVNNMAMWEEDEDSKNE